jgi:hypothetical protein
MNQHPLKDIKTGAQIHPAKSAGLVRMRERTLQTFTALAQQPSTSLSPNPPSVRIDSVTRIWIVFPVSPATSGLANLSSNSQHSQILKQVVTVIAPYRR